MNEPAARPEQLDFPSYVNDGLDAAVAMLLLSRRIHVEDLAPIGQGLASVVFSGEAVEHGLSALTRLAALTPPGRTRDAGERGEAKGKFLSESSFWQALKDFAIPPMKRK